MPAFGLDGLHLSKLTISSSRKRRQHRNTISMKITGLVAFVAALGASSVLAAPAAAAAPAEADGIVARANLPGLNAKQSAHARAIIAETKKEKLGHHGCVTAITTGMTESSLRVLANKKVPASLKYAHDGLGSDHDSVGIFQQRAMYYKDIKCDMDAACSAGLFFKGMKAVKGWQKMDVATLCQRVQRSAVPTAYKKYVGAATKICKAGARRRVLLRARPRQVVGGVAVTGLPDDGVGEHLFDVEPRQQRLEVSAHGGRARGRVARSPRKVEHDAEAHEPREGVDALRDAGRRVHGDGCPDAVGVGLGGGGGGGLGYVAVRGSAGGSGSRGDRGGRGRGRAEEERLGGVGALELEALRAVEAVAGAEVVAQARDEEQLEGGAARVRAALGLGEPAREQEDAQRVVEEGVRQRRAGEREGLDADGRGGDAVGEGGGDGHAIMSEVEHNGWHAVPLDPSKIFHGKPFINEPTAQRVADIAFPDDAVVAYVRDHAKAKLPEKTFNHSMRVYYYATAILREQFPERQLSPVTLALTCLLHDIGTAAEHMAASRMSFEFYGGIQARELLLARGCTQDQADAVCETIIRHQDLGVDGTITFLGQVIQLATIFDNVSDHPSVADFGRVLHADTRDDVIRAFPRGGWLGCFADTVRREIAQKPWCHTTHIPDFADKILGNKLMAQYE
ncbi:cyanamide hydratase [Purpureocillium lavendulum]|uniref:Cyanamide hydratase n=1 Tax=Purpureocillium lavendulum TaxID=1247861 RepID=A0AB34FPV4_9HYPO|nr:cyanamide hydratase [Purpureocillium lavendulum]